MKQKRFLSIVGLLLVMMMIAAACGEDEPTTGDGGPSAEGGGEAGGTYRVLTADFGFTSAFDPTGEYLGSAWGIYSNLLLRTLVTYKHVSGVEGNELVPDLATDLPEPSEDGLTWEFTLKDGITFGPPLSREITSEDVKFAFERIGTESLAAQYGFYYSPIEGMAEFTAGDADEISGIETPDEKTISFTLTQPTGDFLYRLAMPATAPMPEEVAGCFNKAGEYGRYVISTGPYMIEGSDQLDASSCNTLEPISGFDPNKVLTFVRNPDYDESTDDPEVRESLPDEFTITINTNVDDIFNKIKAGEAEGSIDTPTPEVVREYVTSDDLKDRLVPSEGDRTWYLTMNLTQPPFDDIHVRKAVNLVLDKDSMRRAWGGPTAGDIATHIIPPSVTGGAPTAEEYDPYPSEGFAGDPDAAKEEMAQSQYDSDGDGVCDAPECSNILMINRNVEPWTTQEPTVVENLGEIGLEVKARELESGTAYTTIQTVSEQVPLALNAGWGKDYADASTFAVLFDSRSIIPEGNINYSLVGLTADQAADVEAEGTIDGIPNVDADIDACNELLDQERIDCWIDLDRKLMEEVVPWAPYLWATNIDVIGPAVSQFDFDQFSGEAAYAHVAVDESAQN